MFEFLERYDIRCAVAVLVMSGSCLPSGGRHTYNNKIVGDQKVQFCRYSVVIYTWGGIQQFYGRHMCALSEGVDECSFSYCSIVAKAQKDEELPRHTALPIP